MSTRLRLSLLGLAGAFVLLFFFVPPRPFPALITGHVRDGQHPLAGARVRFQGRCPSVSTDARGIYSLPRTENGGRVTAWKEGYAIAGSAALDRPLELFLQPLPERDNEDYRWIEPSPDPARPNNCGNCHAAIYREWSSGAHARSEHNARFLNLLRGTDALGRRSARWSVADEHPLGVGVCSLCHAPTAPAGPRSGDVPGVHCDYCHKVKEVPADGLGTLFGRDALKLLRPEDGRQLFFGPLDDAFREGEQFGHSPVYKDSRYCAACHEGVVFGVHAYGTYSEWRESPAFAQGRHCQDCHMKPTGRLRNVAPGRGGIDRDPRTLASHRFPGGDAETLGRSLRVEVKWDRGRRVVVAVRAEGVGHRVPTGFPDRNVLLVVEAFDRTGEGVPLGEGSVLPEAAGRGLAGKPGRLFAKLLQDEDGKGPVPFWVMPGRERDSRLRPGQTEREAFAFAAAPVRVRVRLLYRRFWPEVAGAKGWADETITVVDRSP